MLVVMVISQQSYFCHGGTPLAACLLSPMGGTTTSSRGTLFVEQEVGTMMMPRGAVSSGRREFSSRTSHSHTLSRAPSPGQLEGTNSLLWVACTLNILKEAIPHLPST